MAGITADIWQRTRSVRRQMKQQLVPQPQLVAHSDAPVIPKLYVFASPPLSKVLLCAQTADEHLNLQLLPVDAAHAHV